MRARPRPFRGSTAAALAVVLSLAPVRPALSAPVAAPKVTLSPAVPVVGLPALDLSLPSTRMGAISLGPSLPPALSSLPSPMAAVSSPKTAPIRSVPVPSAFPAAKIRESIAGDAPAVGSVPNALPLRPLGPGRAAAPAAPRSPGAASAAPETGSVGVLGRFASRLGRRGLRGVSDAAFDGSKITGAFGSAAVSSSGRKGRRASWLRPAHVDSNWLPSPRQTIDHQQGFLARTEKGSIFDWRPIEKSPGHGIAPLDWLIRRVLSRDDRRWNKGFELSNVARREDARVHFYGEQHTNKTLIRREMRQLSRDLRPGKPAIIMLEAYFGPALRGWEAARFLESKGLDPKWLDARGIDETDLEIRGWETLGPYQASGRASMRHSVDRYNLNWTAYSDDRGPGYYIRFAKAAWAAFKSWRAMRKTAIPPRNDEMDRTLSEALKEARSTGATIHVVAGIEHLMRRPLLANVPIIGRDRLRKSLLRVLDGTPYWAGRPADRPGDPVVPKPGTLSAGEAPFSETPKTTGAAFEAFLERIERARDLPSRSRRALLDSFIEERAGSLEGFPLRKGREVLFAFRGEAAPSLAGSWDGWKSRTRLERVEGTDIWIARLTLPSSDRFEYKLIDARGRWHSDPLNRKFSYDNRNSVVNPRGSGRSHLERRKARFDGEELEVVVYMPAGALDEGSRFPVLYMQDGRNLFDPSAPHGGWAVDGALDALIRDGAVPATIVVGVDHPRDRFGAYTHEVEVDGEDKAGGRVADYARFLVEDLKPEIDKAYPTRSRRGDTSILGSSLGGLAALWIAYHRPDVFGRTGGMSPTLRWGNLAGQKRRLRDLLEDWAAKDLRVYMDSGGPGKADPEADGWEETRAFARFLKERGVDPKELRYVWDRNAEHTEEAWRERLAGVLRFLLADRPKSGGRSS